MSLKGFNSDIYRVVSEGSRVLDLGCGNGDLLHTLISKKNVQGYGIEINFDSVLSCIEKGIPVFHGDISEAVTEFKQHAFDTVILSQTLQQVHHPIFLLREIVRVGKTAIVTFPNFSHINVRLSLLFGKIPQTKALPYHWYDTPNIRVASIKSFRQLCHQEGFEILHEQTTLCRAFSNLFNSKGFFILRGNV